MEGGGNEAISREEHLVLRIENCDRVKVGHNEIDRTGNVKISICIRIENEHEIFVPIWDSTTLEIIFSENRE